MPSATEVIKVMESLCFPIMALSQLDDVAHQAVSESLLAATFMMKIIEINDIKEEFEIRSWTVVIEQGPYKFKTQIDYWPQVLNESYVFIREVREIFFTLMILKRLMLKANIYCGHS